MQEEPKRLAPTRATLRELYLKSGNECAFPRCHNRMVNENGVFVGQVCHIEAAERGGERFNPNMTNEERRSFNNLMLMCYEHHKITDDVKRYSVEVLKKMKADHEQKFSCVIEAMQSSIADYGYVKNYRYSRACCRLSQVLGYGLSEEENAGNSMILNQIIDKLKDVPVDTRKLLAIMVARSYLDLYMGCVVSIYEIEHVTGLLPEAMIGHIDILSRRGVCSQIELDDKGNPVVMFKSDRETGWFYWNDIREFCKATGIPTDEICVELNLQVLDE